MCFEDPLAASSFTSRSKEAKQKKFQSGGASSSTALPIAAATTVLPSSDATAGAESFVDRAKAKLRDLQWAGRVGIALSKRGNEWVESQSGVDVLNQRELAVSKADFNEKQSANRGWHVQKGRLPLSAANRLPSLRPTSKARLAQELWGDLELPEGYRLGLDGHAVNQELEQQMVEFLEQVAERNVKLHDTYGEETQQRLVELAGFGELRQAQISNFVDNPKASEKGGLYSDYAAYLGRFSSTLEDINAKRKKKEAAFKLSMARKGFNFWNRE